MSEKQENIWKPLEEFLQNMINISEKLPEQYRLSAFNYLLSLALGQTSVLNQIQLVRDLSPKIGRDESPTV